MCDSHFKCFAQVHLRVSSFSSPIDDYYPVEPVKLLERLMVKPLAREIFVFES